MAQYSKITAPAPDTAALIAAADTIRDAVTAKSITARMVGELFHILSEFSGQAADTLASLVDVHGASSPVRVDFVTPPPARLTCADGVAVKVSARLFPIFSAGSVLFTVTGDAATISPHGTLYPLRPGRCLVNAVATADCSVFASLPLEVVAPSVRLSSDGSFRINPDGSLRLS